MRKKELLYFHDLFRQVKDRLEEEEDTTIEIDRYHDDKGYALNNDEYIRPTSIHRKKSEHKEAIFDLAEGITDYLTDDSAYDDPLEAADTLYPEDMDNAVGSDLTAQYEGKSANDD